MQSIRRYGARRTGSAWALAVLIGAVIVPQAVLAQFVLMEDMTSMELRHKIDSGMKTALVPIGGTEQSGPQLTLGKHNARVLALSQRIAKALGDAAVAPVISYVPEGAINPPSGHMRFAGTISVPAPAFEAILEGSARSLCQHGFRHIFFLGDHGDYQNSLKNVATKLKSLASLGCQVHAVPEYYRAASSGFDEILSKRGYAAKEIGLHAGLADTSLSMALNPNSVRPGELAQAASGGTALGVHGDPTRANAELGELGARLIVDETVKAIRRATSVQ